MKIAIEEIEIVKRVVNLLESYGFKTETSISAFTDKEKLKKVTYTKGESICDMPFMYYIEWDFAKNVCVRYQAVFSGLLDTLEVSTQEDVEKYREAFQTANLDLGWMVEELKLIAKFPTATENCRQLGWKREYNPKQQIWHKDVELDFSSCCIEAIFDNDWNFVKSYIIPINTAYDETDYDEYGWSIYDNDSDVFSVGNEQSVSAVVDMFQTMLKYHNDEVEKLKNAIKQVKEIEK